MRCPHAWMLLLGLVLVACNTGGAVDADARGDAAHPDAHDASPDAPAPDVVVDASADAPRPDTAPDATPDAVADPGADLSPDAGDAGNDAPDYSHVPILERPAEVTVTCTKLHDAVPLADTWAYWMGADLAPAGAEVLLVRGEGNGDVTDVVASTLALDGTLGPSHTLAHLATWSYARPRAVEIAGGVAAVYAAGDASPRLEYVAADVAGSVTAGPLAIAGLSGCSDAAVTTTADGVAVLAVAQSGQGVRFVALDATGAAKGPAVYLPSKGENVSYPAPRLLAVDGGFVAAWTEISYGAGGSQVAAVARLDASGAVLGGVVRLAPEGHGASGPAVVAVPGGYLVAWAESYQPADWNQSGWSVVMVQRFSSDLAPLGPPARVQDPVDAITCHTPVWIDVAPGTPALSFDCGVLYNICAGCVPTETLGVIALHPDTLVPASHKVLLKSPGAGGLLNPRYVRQGNDWYVYADLTYHALSQPSLSALRCE